MTEMLQKLLLRDPVTWTVGENSLSGTHGSSCKLW